MRYFPNRSTIISVGDGEIVHRESFRSEIGESFNPQRSDAEYHPRLLFRGSAKFTCQAEYTRLERSVPFDLHSVNAGRRSFPPSMTIDGQLRMRVSFVDPKAWNYMIYILYLYYTVFRSRIIRECSPSGQRPLVDASLRGSLSTSYQLRRQSEAPEPVWWLSSNEKGYHGIDDALRQPTPAHRRVVLVVGAPRGKQPCRGFVGGNALRLTPSRTPFHRDGQCRAAWNIGPPADPASCISERSEPSSAANWTNNGSSH
ncbi:hypothetical protein CIB48_g7837 [Xylaria polymorpha]|nr:hypothetical protein CIB48_g7837 [Xylaria polymorpha]